MAEQKWYDGKPHWPYPKNGGKFPSPWWPYPKRGGKQGFDQNVKDAVSMVTDGDAIAKEFIDIAVAHGYAGPQEELSVQEAIDALTDTLAGSDVDSGRTIAEAVRALAPYIGAGGGSQRVELFNETVTTVENDGYATAVLAFTGNTDADPLIVTFDGTEYELPRSETTDMMGTTIIYGAPLTEDVPDFSTYPLTLKKNSLGWMAYTETAGTHTIVAYAAPATPTPTPTLGPLQPWPYSTPSTPVVGDSLDFTLYLRVNSLRLGNMSVCAEILPRYDAIAPHPQFPSGMTVTGDLGSTPEFYAVTFAPGTGNNYSYASVRQLDVEVMKDMNGIMFVMPDLTTNGETLVIVGDIV